MNSTKTIFLIDDDPIFVFLTKKTILKTGQEQKIEVFSNGKEAIDFFLGNKKNSELLPEIIFLDLSMPVMDGWQFLDELSTFINEISKKIDIYIVSSSISPLDLEKSTTYSFVKEFIVKPLSQDKYTSIIDKISF